MKTIRCSKTIAGGIAAVLAATTLAVARPAAEPAGAATAGAIAVGVHVDDIGTGGAAQAQWREALAALELGAGRRFDVVATKVESFASTFPTFQEQWARLTAKRVLTRWQTGYTPAVASGTKDSTLLARARAMAAYGAPIQLVYSPSMDTASRSTVTSAASFVAAWRHTHDVFVAAGANNVEWVWCPSANAWNRGTEATWYPGATYVDWVCSEGTVTGSAAPSFTTLFSGLFSRSGTYGKRVMIDSFGALLPTAAETRAWVNAAYATLAATTSPVRLAIYEDGGATRLPAGQEAILTNNLTRSGIYVAPGRPTFTDPLAPAAGALLGALIPQQAVATEQAAWATLNTQTGRPLDVAHTIYPWGRDIVTWREPWHQQSGRISMISWGGGDTREIAAGQHDAYIDSVAAEVGALPGHVFLRWFWEMDSAYFAATAHDGPSFIAAWRHIHDRFAQAGVTNVSWVWAGTAYGFVTGAAQAYYPGSAYVDWVSADGFNGQPLLGGAPQSFPVLFEPFYAWAAQQGKPLMTSATGAVEDSTTSGKANLMTGMDRSTRYLFPAIQALIYFNAAANTYSDPTHIYDWRVNTSTPSLRSWQNFATLAYYRHSG